MLDIVVMDTTSPYFEGAGGQTLRRLGFSKDHRPDLNPMILAVALDGDGLLLCTEMRPGNNADVHNLIPALGRLQPRATFWAAVAHRAPGVRGARK
jgi:transposase